MCIRPGRRPIARRKTVRRALLMVAVSWIVLGCTRTEQADSPPHGQIVLAVKEEALKRRFADGSLSRDERMDAGVELLGLEGGPEFVASHHRGGNRDLVRGLLDSAAAKQPARAARLAAQLMAAAGGEEKLDFEAVLLEQGSDAVAPLTELLDGSGDWQTRVQALDALGKLRAREATGAISACLRDRNTWVRMAAAHALGNVAGPEAADLLAGALEDTADVVVAAALVGLGKTGDPKAMGFCAGQLGHDNPRVRGSAVSAIGRLGGKDAALLVRRMLSDRDEGVQHKARRALEMLGERE